MISSLFGIIKEISPKFVIIEVQGIGFGVSVPNEQVFSVNKEAHIVTQLHWNQETGPQLYGFTCTTTRTAFNLILSCSGIGPKIALALLSQLSAQQFFTYIMLADNKALSSINGIGQKKAEVIIMQLKDKVSKLALTDNLDSETATLTKIRELASALNSLNYSRSEVNHALDYIKEQCNVEISAFDELLRKGLSFLAKRL